MKMWGAIINILSILIIVLLIQSYYNVSITLERDFDQARLDQAVEYSTKAMFQKTLEIEDLDMDYTEMGAVQINSSDALDTFSNLMCFNYELATSDENKRHIENSIASAVLAGSDGFYVTRRTEIDKKLRDGIQGGEWELRWSPKIPYFIRQTGKVYAVNFVERRYAAINEFNTGDSNRPQSITVPMTPGYPLGINDRLAIQSVNNQIVEAMEGEIERNRSNKSLHEYKFYLPSETTVKGVNPIDGPSVLVLLNGVDYASTQQMNAMAVAGFKVVEKINVLGIQEKSTGLYYYCFETQIPLNRLDDFEILDYFGSVRDAAIDPRQFSPHYEFIGNKISRY